MKINFILTTIFVSLIVYASGGDEPTGIVGLTEKDGALGCICHNFEKNDSVFVWIEGPDTIFTGDSSVYKLYLAGGPAVKGGFNIASLTGNFKPADTLTHLIEHLPGDTQLTHTQPLVFFGDTIHWSFKYFAVDSSSIDTIYSVANSVNGDGNPGIEDKWNFGPKFLIHVIDRPNDLRELNSSISTFVLDQNYPNPFNPGTKISFQLEKSGYAKLKIYDCSGSEVITILDDFIQSGYHEVSFNAFNLSTGIYFYKLIVDNYSSVKKMILLK